MRKDVRQKEVKLRKNFFPTLLITLTLWGILAGMVYFVNPFSFAAIPFFFLLTFLALLFTVSTVLANSKQGVIISLAITTFLILRYFGVGNILNLLLIVGVVIAIEIYIYKKF